MQSPGSMPELEMLVGTEVKELDSNTQDQKMLAKTGTINRDRISSSHKKNSS